MTVLQHLREAQLRWADERGTERNGDYVKSLDQNLFQPMNSATGSDYEQGDGCELGRNGERGSMYAVYSSSALVCNFFDYWRGKDLGPLLRACGADSALDDLAFEQKFPTGLQGKSPNLDVLLQQLQTPQRPNEKTVQPMPIESKFVEPYRPRDRGRPPFSSAYFCHGELWEGLEECRRLADELAKSRDRAFVHLDAAQLLKHILGLRRKYQASGFNLVYLWYDVADSPEAQLHRKEIDQFRAAVSKHVAFSSVTYQEVFRRLTPSIKGTSYEDYLRSRYFNDLDLFDDKNSALIPSTAGAEEPTARDVPG